MATRSPFAGLAGVTLLHDVTMAAIAFPLSLYLRLGSSFGIRSNPISGSDSSVFTAIAAVVFTLAGLYRDVWRYASMMDLTAILRAVSLTILLFLPVLFFVTRLQGLPRSALAINWFLLLFLLGAPALRLSAHQGPQPRPCLRARQRAHHRAAGRRRRRRRAVRPRDAARSARRPIGWSAFSTPAPARSAAASTASR